MTNEQQPLDIEAIRAHIAAAPAAPWFIRGTWRGGFFVESASGRETIGQLYTEPAAAFTARAREDIPALLAEVERLRVKLDAYHEIVDALANEAHYQSETGEGSMAYLTRLITKARALLVREQGDG